MIGDLDVTFYGYTACNRCTLDLVYLVGSTGYARFRATPDAGEQGLAGSVFRVCTDVGLRPERIGPHEPSATRMLRKDARERAMPAQRVGAALDGATDACPHRQVRRAAQEGGPIAVARSKQIWCGAIHWPAAWPDPMHVYNRKEKDGGMK